MNLLVRLVPVSGPGCSYLADVVHLGLPVVDELHTILQAAEVLQAVLSGVLPEDTHTGGRVSQNPLLMTSTP